MQIKEQEKHFEHIISSRVSLKFARFARFEFENRIKNLLVKKELRFSRFGQDCSTSGRNLGESMVVVVKILIKSVVAENTWAWARVW